MSCWISIPHIVQFCVFRMLRIKKQQRMTSKGPIQLRTIYVWEVTHDEINGCHGYPQAPSDHSTTQVGVEEAANALQKRGFVTW